MNKETSTQPTTDEVARVAREIWRNQFSHQDLDESFYDSLSQESRDYWVKIAQWHLAQLDTHSAKLREENEGYDKTVSSLKQSADKLVLNIDDLKYEILETRKVRDDLRTQNELLQSQVFRLVYDADCLVEKLNYYANKKTGQSIRTHKRIHYPAVQSAIDGYKHTKKTLPTTPNLCERVRELDKKYSELRDLIDTYLAASYIDNAEDAHENLKLWLKANPKTKD